MRNFEMQASQIVIQERNMKNVSDEIVRILDDSRIFVMGTKAEQVEAKSTMILEVQALHEKQLTKLKTQLVTVNAWLAPNQFEDAAVKIQQVELNVLEPEADVERTFQELSAAVAAVRATGQTGFRASRALPRSLETGMFAILGITSSQSSAQNRHSHAGKSGGVTLEVSSTRAA